jgi:hypothetical protein
MAGTPIVLTLYDPETDEVKATYRRSFVPWKLLKEAVAITRQLNPQKGGESEISSETLDQVAGLIVAVYGNQFTLEDLENGADVTEMISVINQVIAKVNGLSTNPPPAG